MKELNELVGTISGMSVAGVIALVLLAGFALAAYAIYAATGKGQR